jgi:hypothetical protein
VTGAGRARRSSEAVTGRRDRGPTEAVAEACKNARYRPSRDAETQETLEAVSEPVVEAAAETAKSAADDLTCWSASVRSWPRRWPIWA